NHLLASLRGRSGADLSRPPRGRRLFLFIARRGVGKGHFFAALAGEERLEELRTSIGNCSEQPRWPAAFFNSGFSHEVSSIFDQLTEFLVCSAERSLGNSLPQEVSGLRKESHRLRNDRVGRLRHVLRRLSTGKLLPPGRRVILGLSGLSILFDKDGYPKN